MSLPDQHDPLSIWCWQDGKLGHTHQTFGLIGALQEIAPAKVCEFHTGDWSFLSQKRSDLLKSPDLLIGAGHATHLPMLLARWRWGGKIIVLMKPSLPLAWFDLCIIPSHDRVVSQPHLLMTQGVLNHIQPSQQLDSQTGLILIGGTSRHYHWHDELLLDKITIVITSSPLVHWTLTTSRRTPLSFIEKMKTTLAKENFPCTLIEHTVVDGQWLPAQLAQSGVVWVTIDSVSMIYEALTAGSAVGILELPLKRRGRVSQGVEDLALQRKVTFYDAWQQGESLTQASQPFCEAKRCAKWIVQKWLKRNKKS